MSAVDFYWKVGDLLPVLVRTLKSGGVPINLTGATITFWYEPVAGGVQQQATGTVTVTDASNGEVEFAPASGDTDTAGEFWGEFKVVISGKPAHVPNDSHLWFKIHPRIST